MPRPLRANEAGGLYHALNRKDLRAAIFTRLRISLPLSGF